MDNHETTTTPPQLIALGQLLRSPRNARRTVTPVACEELKASILAHGLMQNLVVTDAGDGYYLVAAGLADVMIEPDGLKYHDVAPLSPILQGAGRKFTPKAA